MHVPLCVETKAKTWGMIDSFLFETVNRHRMIMLFTNVFIAYFTKKEIIQMYVSKLNDDTQYNTFQKQE